MNWQYSSRYANIVSAINLPTWPKSPVFIFFIFYDITIDLSKQTNQNSM